MAKANPTNAVKFGNYGIVLEKEQLSYYVDGEVVSVKDVNYEFTNKDLYELATRISAKKAMGPVEYSHKSIISKY
jgi:hypothetical protein